MNVPLEIKYKRHCLSPLLYLFGMSFIMIGAFCDCNSISAAFENLWISPTQHTLYAVVNILKEAPLWYTLDEVIPSGISSVGLRGLIKNQLQPSICQVKLKHLFLIADLKMIS